jgi:hypothetical protein
MAAMAGAAVFVILVAILCGRFALTGKGTVNGKLLGILVVLIVSWLLVASKNTHTATSLASYTAGGVSTVISGLAAFLHDLFK